MGISTDGQLSFGIALEEGIELPWDDEEGEEDIEYWWIYDVLKFKHSFEAYDDSGNRIVSVEKVSEYFDEKFKFLKKNPLPIELVYHCSYDSPMFILAVIDKSFNASRGYPKEIKPENLTISQEEISILTNFVEKFNIEIGEEIPKWWLSSIWG